jgi:hypothetical protein
VPFATIAGENNFDCTGLEEPYDCCSSAGTGDCVDNTGLGGPDSIALDSNNNIYVANSNGGGGGYGSITIYPPLGSSTGLLNESPIATIAGQFNGECTGMGTPYACCMSAGNGDCNDLTGLAFPSSIALDSSQDIYVTNVKGGSCLDGGIGCFNGSSPNGYGSVTGFLALGSSTGLLNSAPFNTISGEFNSRCETGGIPYSCCTASQAGSCVDNTMLNGPKGLFIDVTNSNTIYVTNAGSTSSDTPLTNSVTVYSGGDSGNATPAVVLAGAMTGFNMPFGIALEETYPFLLSVANNGSSKLTTYPTPLTSGDPSPEGTIASGLGDPAGIYQMRVDVGVFVTFVANTIGNTITVYDTDGNLLSTLSSDSFSQPRAVVVIPSP